MSKRKADVLVEKEDEEPPSLLGEVLQLVLSRDWLRWYDAKKLQSVSRDCKAIYDKSPPVPDWERLYKLLSETSLVLREQCQCRFCEPEQQYYGPHDPRTRCPTAEIAQRINIEGTEFQSLSVEKRCERLAMHKASLVSAFRAHFDYQRLNEFVPLECEFGQHWAETQQDYPRRFAFVQNIALHSMAAEEFKLGRCYNFGDILLGQEGGFNTVYDDEEIFPVRFYDGYMSELGSMHDRLIETELRKFQVPPQRRDLLGPILYEKTEIMSVFFTGDDDDQMIVSLDLEDDADLVRQHERSMRAVQGAFQSFQECLEGS